MKKLILLATVLFGLNSITNAQVSVTEDNDIKNFRFGLKGDMSLNWLTPAEKKEILNNGVGFGYSWGLQLEFKLNKTISFNTGLNLLTSSYKLDYKNAPSAGTSSYVLDANSDFVDISGNTDGTYDTSSTFRYNLEQRSFKANYVNIPVLLKMKTNEIGYMTYFGEFGANLNILVQSRVKKDEGVKDITPGVTANEAFVNEDLDMTKSAGIFNAGLRIGGGAEYNFSGSTSLFFSLHYNHYFLSTLRTKDKYLQKENLLEAGTYKSAGQKVTPGAISLTVGILF